MVMKVQKELFTSKWGESSQQQVFQEEPKTKFLQKGAYQEFSTDPPIYDSYSS